MLRSMTAYGRCSRSIGEKEITVEIKSVNNRFLDCSVRLPRSLSYLEDKIKKELTAGKNTRVIPLITPGRDNGNVTFLKVSAPLAPKSAAASKRDASILQSAELICKIIKGTKL